MYQRVTNTPPSLVDVLYVPRWNILSDKNVFAPSLPKPVVAGDSFVMQRLNVGARARLERDDWTCGRDRPPLLTWMALSWRARPGVFEAQLRRRRAFLTRELARARATLRGVRAEVGHPYHEAVWMLTLMIDLLTAELRWLKGVERQAHRRAPAGQAPA